MPFYLIRPGESFRAPDDSVKTGGEYIELPEDLAEHHKAKLNLDSPLTKAQHEQWLADKATAAEADAEARQAAAE